MALWPASRVDALGWLPYRFTTTGALTSYLPLAGSRLNPFIPEESTGYAKTSSIPQGYAPYGTATMPIIAGAMGGAANFDVTGTSSLTNGGVIDGTASFGMTGDGGLSLIVSLSGNGDVSITGAGGLSLTISLDGTANISITGDGSLSMLVPLDGTAAFGIAGAADLKGNLDMEGSWGGAEALSPQGLANAVWGALADSNNAAGTMGELLNNSGAGANPWTVTLDGAYTAADLVRIMAAVLAGKVSGAGSGTETFRSIDDSRNAVVSTVDESGNRTAIVLDPS